MATINPYLIFNGTCEAAFLFYQSVFGSEIPYMGKFKDMPQDANSPELSQEDSNRVMHVCLPIGSMMLMGSDSNSASGDVVFGSNVSISVNVESKEEADKIFNGLSVNGNPYMPMDDTFWGAYFGMLTDQFGINWMVNFDKNGK